jgi:hypothetical protein
VNFLRSHVNLIGEARRLFPEINHNQAFRISPSSNLCVALDPLKEKQFGLNG